MKCPYCNHEHPQGTKYCPITGQKIPEPSIPGCTNRNCVNHGKTDIPSYYKFCPICGSKLNVADVSIPPTETKSVKVSKDDGKDPGFGTFLQVCAILLGIGCVIMAFYTNGLSLPVIYGAVRMYNSGKEMGGKLDF